jgi:hypothetical protein
LSREQYETQADREREQACVQRFVRTFGYSMHKLTGQYSRLDWLLTPIHGGPPAWVEVKCRKHAYERHPTVLLSAAKWREGVSMAQATGGEFILLINFLDGDYAYVYSPGHLTSRKVWLEHGGRTRDTRDAGDIEPVMHISSNLFRRVQS